jgi:hypothetical protein
MGIEIVLDAPDGCKDRCMVCAKRTIGLGIVLDAPNRTPM